MPLHRRYERALQRTAPKAAAQTPGLSLEGYWLDNRLFYFLAEKIDPSSGQIVAVPSIADCESNVAQEIMPLDDLAQLLSAHFRERVDGNALSTAEFDMPDSSTLAVSVLEKDCLIDWRQRRVIESRASSLTPSLYSPDGRYACFVKDHNLWLKERRNGAERPLTRDGTAHFCYGQQSETGLSAVTYRRQRIPMGLWSPDSQWLLTHRIDERFIPELALVQHSPPRGGRSHLHTYKYSMPGDPLPIATYVALHVDSGRMVAFEDFPIPIAAFSPFSFRMAWFDKGDRVWCVRLDRYCKQADLISLDLMKGSGRIVLKENTAAGYLDVHPMFKTPNVRTLADSDEVIWFSERDGWGHLYLYDAYTGSLKNPITQGQWLVRDIVHVDEALRRVLFLAGGLDPKEDPARRSLCAVNLDGSGFTVMLSHDGDIFVPSTEPCGLDQDRPFRPSAAQAGISADVGFALVRYASLERGNRTQIVDLKTRAKCVITSVLPSVNEIRPSHFTVLAADGVTQLQGAMFFPSDFREGKCYPLIDYIYPGPQAAHQPQSFGTVIAALARSLAELGFVIIMLDSRGLPIGSRALHQLGYGELLEPYLADHAAAVTQLCAQHSFLDKEAIGIVGQSAGGAAAARALFDYSSLFRVGVSVCGVHDAGFYSAVWSDKYRGPAAGNAWPGQSNCSAAHQLQGKLLLISGDMDENVHPGQTLSLVDALIRANKDFDLLIVPNAGHDVLMTNGYALRRAWDHFVRHLLDEVPPADFEIRFGSTEVARMQKIWAREVMQ
jgi:dienelactone hydrolase